MENAANFLGPRLVDGLTPVFVGRACVLMRGSRMRVHFPLLLHSSQTCPPPLDFVFYHRATRFATISTTIVDAIGTAETAAGINQERIDSGKKGAKNVSVIILSVSTMIFE